MVYSTNTGWLKTNSASRKCDHKIAMKLKGQFYKIAIKMPNENSLRYGDIKKRWV